MSRIKVVNKKTGEERNYNVTSDEAIKLIEAIDVERFDVEVIEL